MNSFFNSTKTKGERDHRRAKERSHRMKPTLLMPYLGIEPEYTSEEMEYVDIYAPEVIGLMPHDAQSILSGKGVIGEIIGSVIRQKMRRRDVPSTLAAL